MAWNNEEIVQEVLGDQGKFDVTWNGKPGKCRDCGDEIGFGKTKKGKWVLFDLPTNDSDAATVHWKTCDDKK